MYKIAIVGCGYVGLVTGTCFADFGFDVICVDNDKQRIEGLNNGMVPIHEPGLDNVIERNIYYKRLVFSTNIKKCIEESNIIFIAVGTPALENGDVDTRFVCDVAEKIGEYINEYKVIVNKSTVPVGIGKKVEGIISENIKKRGQTIDFDIVSNPEFLRQGTAIHDFLHPDRVVIGSSSQKAIGIIKEIYRVLSLNEVPFIETNIETAELTKYAANAFLAMKITFINEIANLCDNAGANVLHLSKALGKDNRINPKFLHAGPGFGGSCFPKDIRGLVSIGKNFGVDIKLIEAVIDANENQKQHMVYKIENAIGCLNNKTIAVLGLSFKPNTGDLRDAQSIPILSSLVEKGAQIKAYDPVVTEKSKKEFADAASNIEFCENEYDAIAGTDALIIMTEWNQFRNLDLNKVKATMKGEYFFDFRNVYRRNLMESLGFKYIAVGQ